MTDEKEKPLELAPVPEEQKKRVSMIDDIGHEISFADFLVMRVDHGRWTDAAWHLMIFALKSGKPLETMQAVARKFRAPGSYTQPSIWGYLARCIMYDWEEPTDELRKAYRITRIEKKVYHKPVSLLP